MWIAQRCKWALISIHAAHEGPRPAPNSNSLLMQAISIHAAHEGPRLVANVNKIFFVAISIHAAHEGPRPRQSKRTRRKTTDFNPRGPRGTATR